MDFTTQLDVNVSKTTDVGLYEIEGQMRPILVAVLDTYKEHDKDELDLTKITDLLRIRSSGTNGMKHVSREARRGSKLSQKYRHTSMLTEIENTTKTCNDCLRTPHL